MAFARSSVHVQTGLYLEELTEQIEQDDFATQTDYFLDRPPTPLFVPAKTGVDVATQIYENDLFDFELEVQPILEVLCGKTIEQALLEVAEEEELADLRCQQQVLQEIHNADLAEVARLEDRNRRYEEEKQRRKVQYEKAMKLARETAEKIAAKAFTKAYLSPLMKSTFEQLLERGYFYDSVEHDIENNFLEPLVEGVLDSMSYERRARFLLDGLLR
ncbi:radial spoke protein 3, partial [Opisthorchis viverrini]